MQASDPPQAENQWNIPSQQTSPDFSLYPNTQEGSQTGGIISAANHPASSTLIHDQLNPNTYLRGGYQAATFEPLQPGQVFVRDRTSTQTDAEQLEAFLRDAGLLLNRNYEGDGAEDENVGGHAPVTNMRYGNAGIGMEGSQWGGGAGYNGPFPRPPEVLSEAEIQRRQQWDAYVQSTSTGQLSYAIAQSFENGPYMAPGLGRAAHMQSTAGSSQPTAGSSHPTAMPGSGVCGTTPKP
ncbi:hypothetical protein NMY22_g15765 [Coprinellus aureogranulatus]|nr:hypothetical protein NMY22_g15765 [Coprinellus aureogranulatus]